MKSSEFSVEENITSISRYGANGSSLAVACGSSVSILFGGTVATPGNGTPLRGVAQFTKKVKLISSLSFPSDITQIIPDPHGPRIALIGFNFVVILSVPIELWSNCGVAELLQQKYFCESNFVQESVFLGDAQPLEFVWSSEEGGDDLSTFIVILSSDCAIRLYDLNASTGIDYPKVKMDLLTLMPHLSSNDTNTYGLFKSIVSFTILSHSFRVWNILIIDSDGESHVTTVHHSDSSHSVQPLNLPIKISTVIVLSSDNDNIFTSLIASSPNGVVHHLVVVMGEEGVDAIRVVDSLALPSPILSINPFKSGALVQTEDSVYIIDIMPSQRYLASVSMGESLPTWEGMELTECVRHLEGLFVSSIPCISIDIENDSTLLVYITHKGLESTAITHELDLKWVDKPIAGTSTVSTAYSIEEKIKEMVKDLKVISKNIGSSKSEESDLLTCFISTLSSVKHNFEVLRDCVNSTSTWIASDCVSRVDAVNGARTAHDVSILSLYDSLCRSEERMYSNRILTQSLLQRANMLWNSLSSRSIDSEKEMEMIKRLKDHSKQLDELSRTIPKINVDMEMMKRAISLRTESSTRLKRGADVVSIKEEIEALMTRCEGIDKVMVGI